MKSERMQGLGGRIREARLERGMSQDYVACALGGSRQAVSAWERGLASPSAVQLAELSELFCVCAHGLLFGDSFAKSGIKAMMVRKIAVVPKRKTVATLEDQRSWSTSFLADFLAPGRGAEPAEFRMDDVVGDLPP